MSSEANFKIVILWASELRAAMKIDLNPAIVAP